MHIKTLIFTALAVLLSACNESSRNDFMVSHGCFWKLEALYHDEFPNLEAVCGYTGGTNKNPVYENAKSHGHVEVIKINYAPEKISLNQLATIFFTVHQPKLIKTAGELKGKYFRGRIYYFNQQEKELFISFQKKYDNDQTITHILPATEFYIAEDTHQNRNFKNCKLE